MGHMGTYRSSRAVPGGMKALLLATSIALTLAASCTDTVTQDPPSPGTGSPSDTTNTPSFSVSDSPEPPVALAGTSWLLGIMDGGDWPVGDDPDVTLVFHDSRLVGFSGCNRFGAKWQMVEGHIEVGKIASTLVECNGNVGRAEDRILHILSATPAVGNGGVTELRLTGEDGVLVFTRSN